MKYRFMRFPEGKAKALTVSYDDGSRYDRTLVEILNRYGIKGTFNLNSGTFAKQPGEWHMTAGEAGELFLTAGHEIAVHGYKHVAPGQVSAIDGIREVLDGRLGLEQAYGRIIRGMAYPDSGIQSLNGGATANEIKAYLKSLGIVYARTAGGRTNRDDNPSFEMPLDWYEWVPTCHHENPKLMEYLKEFKEKDIDKVYCARRFPHLFYLWGHSFEFDNKKNWNVMEEFCKAAADSEDIWFATNIEIYDYTQAYRSLQFSVDNTIAYNPSLYTIWFDIDGTRFSIKPGETKKLA
ncbi:MAG: polysaccharide deacetylase family protein [Lachnospiraceae bacterium]|nr:polysaccharide deacetylase family protein [Lachnospiraceae bacterium]